MLFNKYFKREFFNSEHHFGGDGLNVAEYEPEDGDGGQKEL